MGIAIQNDIQDRASAIAEVSGGVSQWLAETAALLALLQQTIEHVQPNQQAAPEVRQLIAQLPALVRQCRAQVPTPEMVQTWVRVVMDASDRAPL